MSRVRLSRISVAAIIAVCLLVAAQPVFSQQAASQDYAAIDWAAQSVMMLEVYDKDFNFLCSGSGFVAFNNRTIVTNYHVIEGGYYIDAYSDDDYSYIVNKIFAIDKEKDIAILGFYSPTNLEPLKLHEDSELQRGEPVVAIGSPNGVKNAVTYGNIGAIYQEEGVDTILFSAPISEGSSGGALFNGDMEVIGVTSATYTDTQNMNLAIAIGEVEGLHDQVDEKNATYVDDYWDAHPLAAHTDDVPNRELKPGDEGDAVQSMQVRLIELNYLNGPASGVYDEETGRAVRYFQLNAGLGDPGVATIETLDAMFTDGAVVARATDAALVIPQDANGEWEVTEGGYLRVHIEVENLTFDRPITSYTISAYTMDEEGNRQPADGNTYVLYVGDAVGAGERKYSSYMYVEWPESLKKACFGIESVQYADGTFGTSTDVNYATWTID